MLLVKFPGLIICSLAICLGLQISACTTNSSVDVNRDDLSDLNIDPDQKALSAEGDSNPVDKSDKDVLGNEPGGSAVPETPAHVPATPSLDELNSGSNVVSGGPVEPEAPIYSEPQVSDSSRRDVGSGVQVRFIKAAELNIREEPNRYSKIVGKLRGGQRVKVKIQGGWARLAPNKWIRSRWLTKNMPKNFAASDEAIGAADSQSPKTKKKLKPGKSGVKKSGVKKSTKGRRQVQ